MSVVIEFATRRQVELPRLAQYVCESRRNLPRNTLHQNIGQIARDLRSLIHTHSNRSVIDERAMGAMLAMLHDEAEAAMLDALTLEQQLERVQQRRLVEGRKRRKRARLLKRKTCVRAGPDHSGTAPNQ